MTAIDDRMMGIFENLEVPEGVKAELIRGEIVMMAGLDMVHNLIVSAIQHQSPYARWRSLPVYWSERTTKFGDPIRLDLLDITLDTSEFQTYP